VVQLPRRLRTHAIQRDVTATCTLRRRNEFDKLAIRCVPHSETRRWLHPQIDARRPGFELQQNQAIGFPIAETFK
jgi:hypothetical protein